MRHLRRYRMNHSSGSYSTIVLLFASTLLTACDRMAVPTEPAAMGVSLASSNGHTIWVNDEAPPLPPGNGCPRPDYNSIQLAVNAADPGDRINVCPGTYVEQVTIPAGKNNLWLQSVHRWEAVIKAPADNPLDPIKAIVRVNGALNVTILAFTITGPGSGPCNSLRYGVRVDNGGSADILGNHITDIRDAPPPPLLSGCQNGVAILVGRQLEGQIGSAKIMGNVIERYQKNGPTVDNAGSYADIKHNRIFGAGPTATIAQNGIQVSRGATADIQHNFVSQHIYTPGTDASTGILFYGSGTVRTDHNTLTSNDVGVDMSGYLFGEPLCGTTAGSVMRYNRVRASSFDGFALSGFSTSLCYTVTEVQVANNKIETNGGPGIGVYDTEDNTIDDNHVEDNSQSGILLDNADNNTVGDNKVRDNGTPGADVMDGIRAEATSTGNTIQKNHLRNNLFHDCHDASVGVANFWIDNHAETSFPPGLCAGPGADATAFETSTVYGWDPDYPWYNGLDLVAEYDWAAAYASIDTESLLKLLPAVRTGSIRRPPASPQK